MKTLIKAILSILIPILLFALAWINANQTQAWTATSGNMKKNIYDPWGVRMDLFDRTNHTWSILSNVISDFTTSVNNILSWTWLLKANNLSDILDINIAKNNLWLWTWSNVEFANITWNTISLNWNELTDFEFAFLYGQDQSTAIDQPVQFWTITWATINWTTFAIGNNKLTSAEFSLLDWITEVPLWASDITGKQDLLWTWGNNESLIMSWSEITWKEINQQHNLLTWILGSSYPDYYHIDFWQYQAVWTMTTNQLHFLTAWEVNQLKNIWSYIIDADTWSYLQDLDQPIDSASSVDFGWVTSSSTISAPDITTDIISEKTTWSWIIIDWLALQDKDIENIRTATFDSVYDNWIITWTWVDIDLWNWNNQKVTFSWSTIDLNLIAPKWIWTFKIIITQWSSWWWILGTWWTTIKYPWAIVPVLSITWSYIDILSIFYDWIDYYWVSTNDFQ